MIGIDRVPLSMKDDTKISLDKKDNAKNVNIFVLSSQLQPISEKGAVKMSRRISIKKWHESAIFLYQLFINPLTRIVSDNGY